jgi:tetratricopeptide (TPR) repeat protein
MTQIHSDWLQEYHRARASNAALDLRTWASRVPELADNPGLVDQLEALARSDAERAEAAPPSIHTSLFQARRSAEPEPEAAVGCEPGDVLGGHELVRLIGAGGMGQVWLARDTRLKRDVALKVIRPDRISGRTLEFFAREARASGRIDHSGVVRVLSNGEDRGISWIAMEYVDGSWTLREFLDETSRHDETPEGYYRDVATFLARVADALEAAHTRGVIHRDLKPQNILITPDDEPKVTDFGLARITDESLLSQTGDFAGTYAYMSPEQVAARRIGLDHRTDVFSLGVVMYEMLALRRPFEGDTAAQVGHQIVQKDPPELRSLRSRIPRDLEVICGKCLEKDRDRRYATMADLAADLRRHLASEPILARPPGTLRKLELWARRNPTKTVAGAVAAAAVGVIGWFAVENGRLAEARAEQARIAGENYQQAETARERTATALDELAQQVETSQRLTEFQSSQFAGLDPEVLSPALRNALEAPLDEEGKAALRAALSPADLTGAIRSALGQSVFDAALARVDRDFADDPSVQVPLLEALGAQFLALGYGQRARALWARIEAISTESFGPTAPATLRAVLGQLDAGRILSDYPSNEKLARRALEDLPWDGQLQTADRIHAAASLVGNLGGQARYEEAIELGLRWVDVDRADDAETAKQMVDLNNNLASCLASAGRFADAAVRLEATLEEYGESEVMGHEIGRELLGNLSVLWSQMGRVEESLEAGERAVALAVRAKGSRHPETLRLRVGLALAGFAKWQRLAFEKQPTAAEVAKEVLLSMDDLIEDARYTYGEAHQILLQALNTKSLLLGGTGRASEAVLVLRAALAMGSELHGDDHPVSLQMALNLGQYLVEAGDAEGGLEAFQRVCSVVTASGATDLPAAVAFHNKGYALFQLERYEEAELALLEAHRRFEELFSPEHVRARHTAGALADLYEAWESRPDAAEEAKRWRALAGPGKEREGERNPEEKTGR